MPVIAGKGLTVAFLSAVAGRRALTSPCWRRILGGSEVEAARKVVAWGKWDAMEEEALGCPLGWGGCQLLSASWAWASGEDTDRLVFFLTGRTLYTVCRSQRGIGSEKHPLFRATAHHKY